ncbi:MAG TPA: lantibiotic dehydratase [Pseudonocardiaceae bacterium]|nr:lantibiotic dehydratase [Pseudonocardiaceae bacterium]
MFTVVDAAVLRLATQSSDLDEHRWPDLSGDHLPQWRDWLVRTWADEPFARAVAGASPDLARRVIAVCAGREQRPRQARGAVVSLLRYRLRATSRATPFGLFAGVAPTQFGPTTTVRIGEHHRAVSRVDAVWLSELVSEMERCPGLAGRLPVVLNNTATVRDGRLVIGLRQHPSPAAERTDPAEVSVRHTRAVVLVVHAARTPIGLAELADRIAVEFPDTPVPAITAMLVQLVEQRILLTGLRPPMTATDPLAHVLAVLAEVRAEDVPAAASPLSRLRERSGVGLANGVDLRADAEVVLPRSVATEIAGAASVLAALTPHPFGTPVWRDYHARFLERYGVGAAVPLVELVNPDIGLGYPAGYRDSLLERPTASVGERDTALLRLAQTAALNGDMEIALDDATITELRADNLGKAQWRAHVEVAVRVHALSRAALDRGEFELVVTGAFRAAGTTAGRFPDLLDDADRDRMAAAYTALPTVNEGALRVQVSCPPLYTETENVARHPQVLPALLSIGEHRPARESMLTPEDLLVVGDAHRFTVWSRSTARPVEPEVFSAVEFTNFTHPMLRLACELTTARTAAWGPFAWGIAAQLPFLPRLTYRRTVLSPARWTLASADLPGTHVCWPEWTAAIATWRVQAMVPATVYLGGNDQRLRLDLDQPAHLHLLRAQLDRHGHATLHEAPALESFGWIEGHAHEIVVPLASSHARTWPPLPARTAPITATTPGQGHLPGAGTWLYCKLYGHPDRHTALLTTHLPELLSTLDEPVRWWFLPYRDPDNHLRLRLQLTTPARFGPVAAGVGTWTAGLRQLGLIATMQLDTYRPETGRFGHGPAMDAAEAVFAADSAAALAQREHLAGPDAADARALSAASMVDLAAAFTGEPATGNAWLVEHIATDPAPAPERAIYDQALDLADPYDDRAALRSLAGGERIATAWAARVAALAIYRDTLAHAGAPTQDSVLAALLHLHSVRICGIAPTIERSAHRLARAAALSQTTHRKGRG